MNDPIKYRCLREGCDEVLEGLLNGRIHLRNEHGIPFKSARKWLRVVGPDERLPDPGWLPGELKGGKVIRSVGRSLEDDAFSLGENFAEGYHRTKKLKKVNVPSGSTFALGKKFAVGICVKKHGKKG